MASPGVVVVSPNVAVDSYYVVPSLGLGEVNRASSATHTAGGKGINLARAFQSLGGTPLCLGVTGGHSGEFVESELVREGIAGSFVRVPVPTRHTTSVIETGTGSTTVISDPGDALPASSALGLAAAIQAQGSSAPWLAFVGSLPAGFPDEFFAQETSRAKARGQAVALDTSARSLASAMTAGPTLVKVNRLELSEVLGARVTGSAGALNEAFEDLVGRGVECLIVTDGPHGAYVLSTEAEPFSLSTPVERVVSAVGAGDTFLAAFIHSRNAGADIEHAATEASAAAAANVMQVGCGVLDIDQLDGLRDATRIERPLRVAA